MKIVDTIIDFLLKEQFFIGCMCGSGLVFLVFRLYLSYYKSRSIPLVEMTHEEIWTIVNDKKQPLFLRRRLFVAYVYHEGTTLRDLENVSFGSPDIELEKDPRVKQAIEYAQKKVTRNKKHLA